MNTLVLFPNHRNMRWSYFTDNKAHPAFSGESKVYRTGKNNTASTSDVLRHIQAKCLKAGGQLLDSIALRVAFGGSMFKNATVASPEVLHKLERLIPQAPLHLPVTLELIQRCGEVFPDVPVVLVFETAFFAHLPAREYLYGIDAATAKNMGIKRYGYHGIFHAAACNEMVRFLRNKKLKSPYRIMSVCLEPQPEVTAVIGNRPVMVTGGTTPLEGIPGETTCGELDPSVVLTLAEKKEWGAEQINNILTQESGLAGLVGRKITLSEVFTSDSADIKPARQIITYRILVACGAGMAAMGGLDAIIFSGKYAEFGEILGPYLTSKLSRREPDGKIPSWKCFQNSRDSIIANIASVTVLRESLHQPAKASA